MKSTCKQHDNNESGSKRLRRIRLHADATFISYELEGLLCLEGNIWSTILLAMMTEHRQMSSWAPHDKARSSMYGLF